MRKKKLKANWRKSDPLADATKVDGRYIDAFLLRLNEWEMGALTEVARIEGRSLQMQARIILRKSLKRSLAK